MVHWQRLLALPPALLNLILGFAPLAKADTPDLEWPYNLPPHVKYYPEDEAWVKRNAHIQRKLQEQLPVGIKKMSDDPGEKFFFDYWQFHGEQYSDERCGNTSLFVDLDAPLQLHAKTKPKHGRSILPRILGSRLFDKRDFVCPDGSQACTAIGRPNSCCSIGSTCQLVQDVGLGDVGCCPGNQVCAGSVSKCPSGGYSDCPQNPGGGCCLPGYACFQQGCVATSTAVVYVTPSPTSTSISISSSTATTTSTPPTSSSTSSTTTPPPPTTSTPPNTLVCSSGFRSCPVSLGGGCCPTDRACGRDVCPAMNSTTSFIAPARPTSNTVTATITSTTSLTSIPGAACPTGFYACSAFYQGGCCRTGRNCDTTSCPASGSITVVDGSTITAVAPTGSGISSAATVITGACAQGWSTCARDVGGGCCPIGYACGSMCTATGTGGQNSTIVKGAPNGGSRSLEISLSMAATVVVICTIVMTLSG